MGVRFSSALKESTITLSSNDTVATGNTSTGASALCLPGVNPWNATNAQKVYIEFVITTGDGGTGKCAVGMAKDVDTITWLGAPGRDSFGYWSDGSVIVNNSTVFTASTFTTGDIISIAWDNVTARAWVRKNGGAWANSGNPVTLSGGIQMDAASANGIRNFGVEPGDSGTACAVTLKSRKSEWTYAPPTGYGELADGVVQIKGGTSALATTTPTLDYPITAGNTLLYQIVSGGYLSATPTGFTADSGASIQSGSGANAGMSLFRKTAVGSDTFQHVQSGAFSSVWIIAEIEGLDTTTPFNIAASAYNNAAAGSASISQAATPTGSADYIAVTAVFNETTDAPEDSPFTAIINGFDEARYKGLHGAGGAGGSSYTIAMLTNRGTAAGSAVTGGATVPNTSSGNHVIGGITILLNVSAGGGASPSGATVTATASVARVGSPDRGNRLWRRKAAGRISTTNLFRKAKGQAAPALANLEFFGTVPSVGGASVSGVTVTATASIIPGTATTGVIKAAQTLTATASIISGTVATGTAVSGSTITATASIISGSVTTGALKGGVTVTATASIISGTATYAWTVPGQTLTATASIIAGSVSAGANANVSGVTVTATASIISGIATTGVLTAAQTLTATASIISGTASGGALRSGATVTATASIIAGTASAGGSYTFPGATLTASDSIIPGSLTLTSLLAGVILQADAILIPATRFGSFEWHEKVATNNPWVDGGAGSDIWVPKVPANQPWN